MLTLTYTFSSINIFSGEITCTVVGIGCETLSFVMKSKSACMAAAFFENMQTLISGTVLFRRTKTILKILKHWGKWNHIEASIRHQKILQQLLKGYYTERHEISMFHFPESYNFIKGITNKRIKV